MELERMYVWGTQSERSFRCGGVLLERGGREVRLAFPRGTLMIFR